MNHVGIGQNEPIAVQMVFSLRKWSQVTRGLKATDTLKAISACGLLKGRSPCPIVLYGNISDI